MCKHNEKFPLLLFALLIVYVDIIPQESFFVYCWNLWLFGCIFLGFVIQ